MSSKVRCLAASACIVWGTACCATEPAYSPVQRSLAYPPWDEVRDLPRRFRNHCSFDITHAIYYCSDHCGIDYQVYYCSRKSFGCCHIGHGYCDWNGLLRCRP